MKGWIYLFLAFLCLLAGAAIYIMYKPSSYFIQILFTKPHIQTLQAKLFWVRRIFPDTAFVRYHLSDLFWYQALLWTVHVVYDINKIKHTKTGYYFLFALPFVTEALQYIHLIPGTFDWLDIFWYSVLFFLNYYVYFRKKKTHET
jgi:hypothetical protein